MSLPPTPGQTVGPFFGYALPFEGGPDLVPASHPEAVRLHGRVLDGAGDPVPDALLELWQADADGTVVQRHGSLHRDGYTFTGWGRAATDRSGGYQFVTVRPGTSEPGRAAFFSLVVFARGLLDRLHTRVYLPGQDALASDPLLSSLDDEGRRGLVAVEDATGLRFDVHLQGDRQTTFLRYGRTP
ncbi:protocatechuate 3,4-dioxygenase subunit alpha [Solicola sp. PLA-1-18]|uniref:protocatechuate 3,4-dioxygenase subunit alpha n=1 Tax=Solicola sp. PLA-1-18 TaxID=3380532 RepID=UPI003B79F916